MLDPKKHLSSTLKKHRKNRGWSLDKTARQTGVSKAMLGQIERGESSPTVATLWKMATGLEVSLSSFLEPVPDYEDSAVIRDSTELRRQPAAEGILVAPIFPYEARFGFELFEITLLPGYERLSEPHETGVVEHVSVIEGSVEILIAGKWIKLDKNQSIRFRGDESHGYRNIGKENAVLHDIIHYG